MKSLKDGMLRGNSAISNIVTCEHRTRRPEPVDKDRFSTISACWRACLGTQETHLIWGFTGCKTAGPRVQRPMTCKVTSGRLVGFGGPDIKRHTRNMFVVFVVARSEPIWGRPSMVQGPTRCRRCKRTYKNLLKWYLTHLGRVYRCGGPLSCYPSGHGPYFYCGRHPANGLLKLESS